MTRNKVNINRRFSPFLFIRLLGIIFFIVILSGMDLGEIWSNIRTIEIEFFLYGLAFQVLLLVVKGSRWHILNSGNSQGRVPARSIGEFLESYAIGVITPGRLGELMKAGHARGKNKVMETGLRILVERSIDVGFFAVIAGLAMIIAYAHLIPPYAGYLFTIAGGIIFLMAVFLMRSPLLTRLIQKILDGLPLLRHRFQLEFRSLGMESAFWVVLLSMVSNFSAFLSCYMIAIGLGLDLGFLFISGGIAIAGLLNMLPITVMGLGTREGTFLLLFRPIAEPLILAFSGLVFLVAQVGGGLISLILGQLLLAVVKNKIRKQQI